MKYSQGQRAIEQKMSLLCALACACGIKSDERNTFPVTGEDDFQYPSVIERLDLASSGLRVIYSVSPNTRSLRILSAVLQLSKQQSNPVLLHISLNV